MADAKIIARPWQPQDLIDDLQGIIDEECDNYLNTRRTTLCMARDYLKEHFAEQKWISVKDRLPESGVHILASVKMYGLYCSGHYVCDAFYAAKYAQSIRGYSDECAYVYCEEDDEYYLEEGWYEVIKNWDDYNSIVISDTVTHWMPLPQPPKGE